MTGKEKKAMNDIWEILVVLGVPSTVLGTVLGVVVWYFKRALQRSEKKRDEHEKNLESLVLMMLQAERANTILCKATAEAVRDGHCNGNMTEAMKIVDKASTAEKEFLIDKGIKYIFE